MKEIKLNRELLCSKVFDAKEKLVLGLIMEPELQRFYNPRFLKTHFPCKLTATEIGKLLGMSRRTVLEIIEQLEINGWIVSIKYPEYRARETRPTEKFYHAIGLNV